MLANVHRQTPRMHQATGATAVGTPPAHKQYRSSGLFKILDEGYKAVFDGGIDPCVASSLGTDRY